MIALSEQGRARFADFPELIADDLFLDSLFTDAEKSQVPEVEVVVQAPFGVRDLVRRLVRVRRGMPSSRRPRSGQSSTSTYDRPTPGPGCETSSRATFVCSRRRCRTSSSPCGPVR